MMQFIVTTPARQSLEENRRLIRSYVMRGRNRKKLPLRHTPWIGGGKVDGTFNTTKKKAHSIPIKVGGEFSFAAVSEEMDPAMLEMIWKLREEILPHGCNLVSSQTEQSWFAPIWNDAACLHFTIFIAKIYLDFVHGQNTNNTMALSHHVKALSILQQRLTSSNTELSTSDSTILVVVGLAMAANFLGDHETASNHVKGLHKMVELRGGEARRVILPGTFTNIDSADLRVALGTGCEPFFFSDGVFSNSCIALQRRTLVSDVQDTESNPQISTSALELFLDSMDMRVRLIWNDFSEVVRAANIITQCELSINTELYQEVMVSIHYRLFNICFELGDVNEVTRLALLALASAIFLQWRGIKARYEYLARDLQRALSLLGQKPRAIPAQFTLWLYIIGSVSVFNKYEQACFQPALTEVIRDIGLKTWNEVRISLYSVLWVNTEYDPLAKQIVEDALLKL